MASTTQQLELPPTPRSVTVARHFVRGVLIGWGLEELGDDAQLGVAELVANSVEHAGTEIVLTVRRDQDDSQVLVEVTDQVSQLDVPAGGPQDATASSGRGLQIVQAIADDWGIERADTGKTVWFALPVPASGRRDADLFDLGRRRDQADAVDHRGGDPDRSAARGAEPGQGQLRLRRFGDGHGERFRTAN